MPRMAHAARVQGCVALLHSNHRAARLDERASACDSSAASAASATSGHIIRPDSSPHSSPHPKRCLGLTLSAAPPALTLSGPGLTFIVRAVAKRDVDRHQS